MTVNGCLSIEQFVFMTYMAAQLSNLSPKKCHKIASSPVHIVSIVFSFQ